MQDKNTRKISEQGEFSDAVHHNRVNVLCSNLDIFFLNIYNYFLHCPRCSKDTLV